MEKNYQVVSRQDRRALAHWLAKHGQGLLPLVELVERTDLALEELVDVTERVACADGDAAPSGLRGRPQRTPNVDRASVGNGCAASPNRGAQAQRYASSAFPL